MVAPASYPDSYYFESSVDLVSEDLKSQAEQQACSTRSVDLACPLPKPCLKTCRRQLAVWADYLLVSHSAFLHQTMPLQGRLTEVSGPKHTPGAKKTVRYYLRPRAVILQYFPTIALSIPSPGASGPGVSLDLRLQHPMSTLSCIRNTRGPGRGTESNRVGAGHIVLLAWSRQSSRLGLR